MHGVEIGSGIDYNLGQFINKKLKLPNPNVPSEKDLTYEVCIDYCIECVCAHQMNRVLE